MRKGLGGKERSGTLAGHSQPAGPDACPRLPWPPPSGRTPAGLLCGPCADNTRWLIIHPPRAGHGGREPIRTQLQSVGSFREGRRGRTEVSEGTTDALLSHAFLAGTEEPKRPRKPPLPGVTKNPRSRHPPPVRPPQLPLHLSRLLFAGLLVRSPLCQGSFVFFSKEVWRALI